MNYLLKNKWYFIIESTRGYRCAWPLVKGVLSGDPDTNPFHIPIPILFSPLYSLVSIHNGCVIGIGKAERNHISASLGK